MDAVALVFGDEQVVPEGIRLGSLVGTNHDRTGLVKQTSLDQVSFEGLKTGIHLGHGAVHVEGRGTRVALDAVRNVGCEGMVGCIAAHVAGDTSVRYGGVVGARASGNIRRTTNTHQNRCFRTVVRTPMRAVDLDGPIGSRGGDGCARLVTIGAQVTLAAVICRSWQRIKRNCCRGFEREVGIGIGGVDLMAGAAIDAGRVRINGLKVIRVRFPGCHAIAEANTGMATGAGCATASNTEGDTGRMDGSAVGCRRSIDQGRVIVALGTGQFGSLGGSTGWTLAPAGPAGP